jgi:hypothetical protein
MYCSRPLADTSAFAVQVSWAPTGRVNFSQTCACPAQPHDQALHSLSGCSTHRCHRDKCTGMTDSKRLLLMQAPGLCRPHPEPSSHKGLHRPYSPMLLQASGLCGPHLESVRAGLAVPVAQQAPGVCLCPVLAGRQGDGTWAGVKRAGE